MTAPIVDPMVGRTIAQYDILSRVGGGGMGVVYRARDAKLGRTVALKFLPQQWSHDETAKQRFVREAQAASATNHPNICTIHDIETADDGQLFIVMAYYEGQTLKQRLEQGPLSADEALDIATQIADGLAKAHAQGVVHRDIKPGNVMLTEDGVRILDFGLATFADALKLTIEHSTLGTTAYMSPEQVQGRSADARADVWAAGVVLYEMLAGHVPFQGTHTEAVSYAIRNETPAPLRSSRPGIPEEVEQLVFRALHKEPSVRYQSGREMARALRLVRGQSLPLDLRTEPVPLEPSRPEQRPRPDHRRNRVLAAVAGVVLTAGIGFGLVWFVPLASTPVAVAPVVNLSGQDELDPYRLAFTHELVEQLAESSPIRVVSYDQLLPVLRQFLRTDADTGRRAIEAITAYSGADIVIVPTLLYENGWKARIEFRRAGTGIDDHVFETEPIVSALDLNTTYGMMPGLADRIEEYFSQLGGLRARTARALRRLARRGPARTTRFRTLEAAAEFEKGVNSFDELEYAAALQSFREAVAREPRNPLPLAWQGRVARMMRRDEEAEKAAKQALELLSSEAGGRRRLFAEAIAAEASGDIETANGRYRALVAESPEDTARLIPLAGFLERRRQSADAIAILHRVLALNDRLATPHLALCRLYNPRELANARKHGLLALEAFQALGDSGGEGQARFCLVDILRLGTVAEKQQARQLAEEAQKIFERLGYEYNTARAYNYLALAAGALRNYADAARFGEAALTGARSVGNRVLEALVLMNLGVSLDALGNPGQAYARFQDSASIFTTLGEDQRAGELKANAGSILVEYSNDPVRGLHDVENASDVARERGNTSFEVHAVMFKARYLRYVARYREAEQELNRAISIARQRDLIDDIQPLRTDLGATYLAREDYSAAYTELESAVRDGDAAAGARIHLARTLIRLGDVDAARVQLDQAETDIQQHRGDAALLPSLDLARGELAYERNQLTDALAHLSRAFSRDDGEFRHPASLDAQALYAFLQSFGRNPQDARASIRKTLDWARKAGRIPLEATCRLYLAQIDLRARKFEEALQTLAGIPGDSESAMIGPVSRASMRYVKGLALSGLGRVGEAEKELEAARDTLLGVQASLAPRYRDSFARSSRVARILSR